MTPQPRENQQTPAWLSRLTLGELASVAGGEPDFHNRWKAKAKVLEAAAEFRDQAAVPGSAGMTGAERSFHRIRTASQRATLDLANEILRRHQDGQDPLRIQPRAGCWQEPTVERWRKNLVQEFEQFNEREMRDEHIEAYGFAVMTPGRHGVAQEDHRG